MITILEFEERAFLVLGPKTAKNFLAKIKYSDGCWHWTAFKDKGGYGNFRVGTYYQAPRVSFLVAHGEWPEHFALHTCNNPGCVNPNHLYDGTHQQNMNDRKRSGHYGKKLTDSDVTLIKGMLAKRVSHKIIAKLFDISTDVVSDISTGILWKD